ncbi:hypothetical protein LB467_15915 [Salegentibacter sp. JZCK2]|uniref:hypothetical protein n=1 Tax=Salegentibacter tibetensis TaxID=2873600 RepID=UPI001CCD594B|nr:hypothetical protein [Salegentibacter tibetensis]MBZ9731181.1 hypothetical protein [Salegentibacter tibetensis]
MIIKIECKIIGDFTITDNCQIKYHPYEIEINFNETNQKFYISLLKKITNYSNLLPKLEIAENDERTIKFPSQVFLKEEIELLQHIESFGALDKEIYNIEWDNLSIEWLPETEQEEKELTIKKHSYTLSFKGKKEIIDKDWLFYTIIHKRRLNHLTLPLSFFRIGLKYYKSFQYQEAFLNFYLMLEGIFGNNKFKNEHIKSEFQKSQVLSKAILRLLDQLKKSDLKHYGWFSEMCAKYHKEASVDGAIHILVEQRGNLSHFSNINPKKHKNPFRNKDFDSLAFITLMICKYVSIDLRLEPFRG